MADVTVVSADVRPLPGCVIRRFTAGGTINMGEPVYLSGNNTVSQADGSAVATAACIGVAVATPDGGTSVAAGEEVDVVLLGPVAGYSTNMGYGAYFYVDDDGGVISTATGTKTTIIGVGLSGSVLLVRPQVVSLS
jgi:hypothetical protein